MLQSLILPLLVAVAVQAPPAPQPKNENAEVCLSCHADRQMAVSAAERRVPGPFRRPGRVRQVGPRRQTRLHRLSHRHHRRAARAASRFKTKREFTIAYYEACKRCHFANYSKTLDSVHYASIARGDKMAPICVDCHGAHDVTRPDQPRSRISQTCAACHAACRRRTRRACTAGRWSRRRTPTCPSCTDCHHSHDIAGPHAPGWRLKSPELCATCHANEHVDEEVRRSRPT